MSDPAATRCLIVEDSLISRTVLEGFVDHHPDLVLAGSVGTLADAAARLNQGGIQLVLLDVELSDGSGVNLARRLDRDVQCIFVTGEEAYARDAYQHRAADFLLKPVGYRRFEEAIERAHKLARPTDARGAAAG